MLVWQGGKDPNEVNDFDIDWTARLAGDTIVSSSWAISGGDAPASGTLSITSNSFSAKLTKVVLSAGNLGITYTLTNTVTTAAGDTLIELVQLPVRNVVAAANLTTLANAMQWIGATEDKDGKVARLIGFISTLIQNFLSFQVLQSSYTRTFNGQGTRAFFVPDLPLVSVQSLTIDGVNVPRGSVTNGGQSVGFYNDKNAVHLIGYFFNRGIQNITMTYTAGFATVPPDIEQACLEWIKIVYASGTLPFGSNVVKVQAGDTSFDFGGTGMVTDVNKIPMPPSIFLALQPYQRVAQISGW